MFTVTIPYKNHKSLKFDGKLLTIVDSPGFNFHNFENLVKEYI